jgi:DNA polymerase bacteriophage-type
MPLFNWNPAAVRFIDLETQSAVDLKAAGVKRYLADPTTRLMSAVWMDSGQLAAWIPSDRAPSGIRPERCWPDGFGSGNLTLHIGDMPPELADHSRTWVAHNAAGFDALAWQQWYGSPEWCDTLPLARAAGLPGKLDELAKVFLGRGKEDDRAARMLFTAKNGRYVTGTPALWEAMLRYNVADVILLARVWEEVSDYGEADVLAADAAVNERGIKADRKLLTALLDRWQVVENAAGERVSELTGGKLHGGNLKSVPQVGRWLRGQGLLLDKLDKHAVAEFLDNPEDFLQDSDAAPLVTEVLKLRQAVTRAGRGKLQAILGAMDADDRVRHSLVYWGAHTGRWSGRGIQPQNFVRGSNTAKLLHDWETEGKLPDEPDALSSLVRPVFLGDKPLAICDYAAIEARGTAWVAGEEKLLSLFATGQDVYLDMAARLFGRECPKKGPERQIGKVIVLGAGYGMGVRKFGAYCAANKIDLEAVGLTPEACIKAYRASYPGIPAVWKAYQNAAFDAVRGRPGYAGRCYFTTRDRSLVIRLPSGRELIYRAARIEDAIPGYVKLLGLPEVKRPCLMYRHPQLPSEYGKQLYGGLLTENIVQAVCRDLLATAVVRMEAEEGATVLHVHDEIVTEGSGELLARVMSEPPAWADGFPVSCEAYTAARYVKEPPPGSEHWEYRNGVRV